MCSVLTHSNKSCEAGHQTPLPTIAASVPRSRISSTLPAFTIAVPNSRLSSTLPADSGSVHQKKPGSDRRGFRHKDNGRRDHRSRQPGRSKRHQSNKPAELLLRVVPITDCIDDSQGSCLQKHLAISDVITHSTSKPANDDDDDIDTASWQFQRTARVRQGKFFKKSGGRTARATATDVPSGTTNEERPQQVCS